MNLEKFLKLQPNLTTDPINPFIARRYWSLGRLGYFDIWLSKNRTYTLGYSANRARFHIQGEPFHYFTIWYAKNPLSSSERLSFLLRIGKPRTYER